jgi:S-adenosylmethionine:tRNA ribosyltransferase-isomerase
VDVSLFDFALPEERIALRPVEPRTAARLLVVQPETKLTDATIANLPDYFRAGDALVINNTRVIPTQLFGTRGAAHIGATLIKRVAEGRWWAFVRNAKRARIHDNIDFGHGLIARVLEKAEDGQVLLGFSGYNGTFESALERYGAMPLPPYIAARRTADAQDVKDYQTAFARHDGSVAAPTAGLHFTPELLEILRAKGVLILEVTLHVGSGTFLPVKAKDTAEHIMHAEWGEVGADVALNLRAVKEAGGRVICVGTTSLRLIESAVTSDGNISAFKGETAIFITPGFQFKIVDALVTNFHLPKSTLFMLTCAMSGIESMQSAYAHAIKTGYRFYSYGDACLLLR